MEALENVIQATQLLQVNKKTLEDVDAICEVCSSLNTLQVIVQTSDVFVLLPKTAILRFITEYPSVFQFSIDLFVITNDPTKTGDAFIKPLSTDFLGCTVVSSSISAIFQRKEKAVHVCIRATSTLLWPLLLINTAGFQCPSLRH